MRTIKKNKGIATLPTVIVIGIMALAVVVSITSIALNELIMSQGQAASGTALFYSEAGARDALIKIARNKKYTCSVAANCHVNFNTTDYSEVLVTTNVDDTVKTITSKGIIKSISRSVQVIANLDTTGKITSTTWSELTN